MMEETDEIKRLSLCTNSNISYLLHLKSGPAHILSPLVYTLQLGKLQSYACMCDNFSGQISYLRIRWEVVNLRDPVGHVCPLHSVASQVFYPNYVHHYSQEILTPQGTGYAQVLYPCFTKVFWSKIFIPREPSSAQVCHVRVYNFPLGTLTPMTSRGHAARIYSSSALVFRPSYYVHSLLLESFTSQDSGPIYYILHPYYIHSLLFEIFSPDSGPACLFYPDKTYIFTPQHYLTVSYCDFLFQNHPT